jgi:hypothetical protein
VHVFSQDIRCTVAEVPVDMRTEEDPADFPRTIIDLMVNVHCTAQESLAILVVKS